MDRMRQNRTLKALAIATKLHESGVRFADALLIKINQGLFWTTVVKATGRDGKLSGATKREALFYLFAMEWNSGESHGR